MSAVPGARAGRRVTPRNILLHDKNLTYARAMNVSNAKSRDGRNTGFEWELREGTIMGLITATTVWTPCRRTTLVGDQGAGATFTVVDTRAFLVGDVVTVDTTAGRTITAIDHAALTITVSGANIDPGANAPLFAQDGSETARGILNEFLTFFDPDTLTYADQQCGGIIVGGGMVRDTDVLGDLAACLADANNKLGFIQFGSRYGES